MIDHVACKLHTQHARSLIFLFFSISVRKSIMSCSIVGLMMFFGLNGLVASFFGPYITKDGFFGLFPGGVTKNYVDAYAAKVPH